MLAKKTEIIKRISNKDRDSILFELESVPDVAWTKHANNEKIKDNKTHLQDGKSIWLHYLTQDLYYDKVHNITYHRYFPFTVNFIKSIAKYNLVGRCYFHKLEPGDKILKHNDQSVTQDMPIKNRYQVYFDIPNDVELILDDQNVENTKIYENSLVDFALNLDHYYENKATSQASWIFLVFDILETRAIIRNIRDDHFYSGV